MLDHSAIESDFQSLHLWRPAFVDELGYPARDGVMFRPFILGDERQTYAQDRSGQWVEVEVLPMTMQRDARVAAGV